MNRFSLTSALAVSLMLLLAGLAGAETVKGEVKALAAESRLFSLIVGQERILLVSWDNKTAWHGLTGPGEIRPDETLTVDFRPGKESRVASSVSRKKTPLPPGIRTVTLDQLTAYPGDSGKHARLVVDTRAPGLFDGGHIAGAVSMPLAKLEKLRSGVLPEDKGVELVFYDEGQGGDSAGRAAVIAKAAGYREIAIFPEGASGWRNSGRQLASSAAFIRKAKPVVIDLRPQDQVAQGHIGGAVNFPAPLQKKTYNYLPQDRLAPIVLYGTTDQEAITAAETLHAWGYRRVTIYPGGIASWTAGAEALETGPAEEEIVSPAANRGQLNAKDFEMALISPVSVEIVDARNAAEQKKGGFPQEKKIPLGELVKKQGELDRDKIQVVFADDPLRAEMAYDLLRTSGYKVNYFNGSVEFAGDGKYHLK